MDSSLVISRIDLRSDAVAIVIIVVALALILYINRVPIGRRIREWRSRRGLDRLGGQQIRELRCPDGLEGFYILDRLVLTNSAILLISHKPFGGNIFCAERIDQWTQVIGQKSFKFDNPLFELDHQRNALQAIVGKAELRAYIYFDESASFPKGHPPSVLVAGEIPESMLAPNCQSPRHDIQTAWDRLQKYHQTQTEMSDVTDEASA